MQKRVKFLACFVPFSYAGTKQSTPFRPISRALCANENMKIIRLSLLLWGLLCFALVGIGGLSFPMIKLPTPMALATIEDRYIDLELLTKEEVEEYEFNKQWIVWNYEGLLGSSLTRMKCLAILGIFTGLISILGAVFWPRITRLSN